MKSHKHHTSSKSGKSEKSTTKGTSVPGRSSSATATRSFEQVFGRGEPEEAQNLRDTLALTKLKLVGLEQQVPRLALYRVKHRAKVNRLKKYARDLEEAIESLRKTATA